MLEKSAPRPYSPCKVNPSSFGVGVGAGVGVAFQILQKPFRGEGNTGDHSGPIAARGRALSPSQTLAEWGFLPSFLRSQLSLGCC